MIKCPNCTANLNYDVKKSKVTCEYCGSTFDPKTVKIEVKKAEEKEIKKEEIKTKTETKEEEKKQEKDVVGTYEGKSYSCSQCGATLLTFDETAITFCSYCGSQAMIESKMIKKNNPQFIIPFKKTKEDCIKNYKKKINRSIFAPKYMKSDIVVSKFRGIYIPYCIYNVSFHGNKSFYGSVYAYSWGDYAYYNDYSISAQIDSDIEGISFDILSNLSDEFSHSIPHDFKEAEPFNTNYLAGFYADTADVESNIYEDNSLKIADEQSSKYINKHRKFRRYGCKNPRISYKVSEKNTGMFPLYFLAIRDKTNTYVNYAVVNGQTGKVAADIPVDFKKYVIVSLILTIPMFLFINSFLLLTPTEVCYFSIGASVVSIIMSFKQMHQMHLRQMRLNDEGYMTKSNNKNKDYEINLQYILKQFIAIILCIAVLVINFVDDIYYYGAAIIGLCLVIWSFYDLIQEHNLIVSTKLPQLEKRGGSENETK